MKIIIQITKSARFLNPHEDSIGYLRSILTGLHHHGRIKDMHLTAASSKEDIITVTMLPQGDVNPVDLEPEIRQKIAMHSELKIVSIEGVRNRKKFPGLQFVSKSPTDSITFIVNPAYAMFLANDVARAKTYTKPEIYEVSFMFEELEHNPGEYKYTGTACTLSHRNLMHRQKNAYNQFAQIIVNDDNLRENILNELTGYIQFTVNPDGSSQVAYSERYLSASEPTVH